jgi:hypothetical protein
MPPSTEQYAELAALFTTEVGEKAKPSIELLLPAHLPVQGGLWLVPYAGREAADGMAILIRMHEDTVDVAAIGKGTVDFARCTSMEDVLERVASQQVHWIVQPPIDADPTSLLHCDADSVTLLSGDDQAAVVGAYRLLKGLITTSSDLGALPAMRLVVVGAEERAANEAASRIIQTAHHQLGVTIEVGTPLPAMGSSCAVISQISFARSSNVVDLLGRIRSGCVVEEELPITHRFEGAAEEPVIQAVVEPPVLEPTVQEHAEIAMQESKDEASYASYVDGLLAISPRCPEHKHIELTIDSQGCLHVLANAEDIRDVSIVSAWAVRHRDLLVMACGGLQIDVHADPKQHLFTDNAVSVADLYGTGVRLHLLTEVTIDGHCGMFCTPLNEERVPTPGA